MLFKRSFESHSEQLMYTADRMKTSRNVGTRLVGRIASQIPNVSTLQGAERSYAYTNGIYIPTKWTYGKVIDETGTKEIQQAESEVHLGKRAGELALRVDLLALTQGEAERHATLQKNRDEKVLIRSKELTDEEAITLAESIAELIEDRKMKTDVSLEDQLAHSAELMALAVGQRDFETCKALWMLPLAPEPKPRTD